MKRNEILGIRSLSLRKRLQWLDQQPLPLTTENLMKEEERNKGKKEKRKNRERMNGRILGMGPLHFGLGEGNKMRWR